MFLSKLTVNVTSQQFRRDYANVHDMHRTIMSAYPQVSSETTPPRAAHGVLWRMDDSQRGFTLYVQSHVQPDWTALSNGYLTKPAQVRSLQPVLDAVTTGRKLAFRLVANPTRTIRPDDEAGSYRQGKRVVHRLPDKQIQWLARKGEQHGFMLPPAANGHHDVAPSPRPRLRGIKHKGTKPVTIDPIRYDGHLVVTDPDKFIAALRHGIGRAKAYGCGLLTLTPPRSRYLQHIDI